MYKSSRDIKDLHPKMQALFVQFDSAMKRANIDYIVTCTYRNDEDQNELYALGRTKRGNVVTNARAGESLHNHVNADTGKPESLAFDICIMQNGKCDWSTQNPAWKRAGEIGTKIGLEWAGNWKSFKEYPHFQLGTY